MVKDIVFVVFSNYNYKEHKYNVLKECLCSWIKDENYNFIPFEIDIKYIYTNPDNDDKMIIVSASKDWIKRCRLESIIDNKLFSAAEYLSSFTEKLSF